MKIQMSNYLLRVLCFEINFQLFFYLFYNIVVIYNSSDHTGIVVMISSIHLFILFRLVVQS